MRLGWIRFLVSILERDVGVRDFGYAHMTWE